MTEKHNDATRNRPSGDRVIDAASLKIDLNARIREIKNEDAWQKNDRNSITVFKTDDMRVVLGGLHKGAELLPHKADGIMTLQILEGNLEITTDELTESMDSGHMIAIHKGCNYRVTANEESIFLLTISNVSAKTP